GANDMEEAAGQPNPPAWAENVLRSLLKPDDRESVSGDLLEEFRDTVLPSCGRARADLWYMRQVAGFVWRRAWLPGMLLAASVLGREALDWRLSPTTEFYARAMVSTWLAISIFTGAGWWSAWRTRSVAAGALPGPAPGVIPAHVVGLVCLVVLVLWHE